MPGRPAAITARLALPENIRGADPPWTCAYAAPRCRPFSDGRTPAVAPAGTPYPPSAASIDPELVAESVTEDGYYVDSSASYLKSDADLDKLRAAIEGAGRAGVVVLPAGYPPGPVISRLLNEPNRKATYVVLSGSRLQAVSNNIPSATVNGLVAKARRAGNPKSEVLTFLNLLSGKHATTGGAHDGRPLAGLPRGPRPAPAPVPVPARRAPPRSRRPRRTPAAATSCSTASSASS